MAIRFSTTEESIQRAGTTIDGKRYDPVTDWAKWLEERPEPSEVADTNSLLLDKELAMMFEQMSVEEEDDFLVSAVEHNMEISEIATKQIATEDKSNG